MRRQFLTFIPTTRAMRKAPASVPLLLHHTHCIVRCKLTPPWQMQFHSCCRWAAYFLRDTRHNESRVKSGGLNLCFLPVTSVADVVHVPSQKRSVDLPTWINREAWFTCDVRAGANRSALR